MTTTCCMLKVKVQVYRRRRTRMRISSSEFGTQTEDCLRHDKEEKLPLKAKFHWESWNSDDTPVPSLHQRLFVTLFSFYVFLCLFCVLLIYPHSLITWHLYKLQFVSVALFDLLQNSSFIFSLFLYTYFIRSYFFILYLWHFISMPPSETLINCHVVTR